MEPEKMYVERSADSTLTLKEKGMIDMVELRTVTRQQLSFYLEDGNLTLRCRAVTCDSRISQAGDKIIELHLVCEDISARYKVLINATKDCVEQLRMQNMFTLET